jgi:hypothetical protein
MEDIDPELLNALLAKLETGRWDDFLDSGRSCAWCRFPVRIRGMVVEGQGSDRSVAFTTDALPDSVFLKACGSRRESRCPACARTYRTDARHLVRAGLLGGKGVDPSVVEHPAVFLTLTAPSYGAVHSTRTGGCRPGPAHPRCPHGLPRSCPERHDEDDDLVGASLCPGCYDYRGAVLHNASTPELWRRTTIYLVRELAGVLGLSQRQARDVVRLSYCRVAEFQARGLVHLHAVVRADSPEGGVPPVTSQELVGACLRVVRSVRVPYEGGLAVWGGEVHVAQLELADGQADRIASYVAKYATKSADDSGVLDRPIRTREDLDGRQLTPHVRRMVEMAWDLGAGPVPGRLPLRRYAHAFGYGGQFLTKSRGYSTTFGELRADRARWREAQRRRDVAPPKEHVPSVEPTSTWQVVGIGWADRAEALLAEERRLTWLEEQRMADEEFYSS